MSKVVRLKTGESIDTTPGGEFDQQNFIENQNSVPRVVRREVVTKTPEVKTIVANSWDSFFDYLKGRGYDNLAAYQALSYYANVSVVYDAVDDIVTPGKMIKPFLYNEKKQEWITEHPLLTLLENPGGGMTGELFRSFYLIHKLVVGTVFSVATGFKENPPLELLIGFPQDMTLQGDSKGYLSTIYQSQQGDQNVYRRDDTLNGNMFRYFTQDDQREIFVSRTANTRYSGNNQWGLSPLKPLMLEIEQFNSQNVHNNSVLKRGATPSLMFSAEGALNDQQYARLNDSILNYYQGAMNAGQPIIGENGMKVDVLTNSNKDMDFDNMVKSLSARVYNIFNIPLPSVMTSTMTMANLEASKLMKYDDAILPAVKSMFSDLTTLLIPRYRELEGYVITYDPATIEALEPRRLATAQSEKALNAVSTNELRTKYLSRESIGPAGDDILVPANMVPLGEDKDTSDAAQGGPQAGKKPPEEEIAAVDDDNTLLDDADEVEDISDAAKFIASIKRTMKCSDDKALELAVEHGLITNMDELRAECKNMGINNEAGVLVKAMDLGLVRDKDFEEEK